MAVFSPPGGGAGKYRFEKYGCQQKQGHPTDGFGKLSVRKAFNPL